MNDCMMLIVLFLSSVQVLPNTQTPNKDTGLVSKAMEYIFGW